MKKEKDVETVKVKKAVEKQQSKIEATTLGEIEGFSALKEQFQENAKAKLAASSPATSNEAAKSEPVTEPVVEAVAETPAHVNETEAPAAEVSEEVKKPSKASKGDDLKLIEGIGPKIAELLIADGISNFRELADAPVDRIKDILEKAGARYKMHDPTSWPQQAGLAADGKMDELKILQDSLKAGKAE